MGVGAGADPAAAVQEEENGCGGAATAVSCSICFEAVLDAAGDRSTARLQCGHQFHLDCIGSAFNAKGVMQCPNCRKVEKGSWLYSNGCRSLPELGMEAWIHDEDLYDFSYSDMPIGIHWCPFSRLAQMSASFEEGGSPPAFAFEDLLWHHPIFPDHPASSAAGQECPYMAYLQPLQPSSSLNPSVPSESPIDAPAYHHWNRVSGSSDAHTQPIPSIDHYHGWEHQTLPQFTPNNRSSGSGQASISSATMRASRLDSDGIQRAGSLIHPFILGHSSNSRMGGSFGSSLVPSYASNSRVHAPLREHQQHHNSTSIHGPAFAGVARRSGGVRGLAPVGPARHPPSDHSAFYVFPPTDPSGQSIQDTENTTNTHLYAWERDRFAPFPLMPMNMEWPPLPQSSGSDSSSRMGSWQWNGSERSTFHGRSEGSSYRPNHNTRTHHFV